ncbi:MAG: VWA domain-containing protein [Burkholderiales bacterium]|nr:VWA domain-containing protein [Burkholderiales bacterium]
MSPAARNMLARVQKGAPMYNPAILLTPLKQAISSAGGTFEVLIRVQAPQPPQSGTAQRQPLRLALVVDRSGSMDGQPLNEAMRCVTHIVDRLHPDDQVAVVLYDDQVKVPVPLQPASRREAIHAALTGVESGGSTALFAGWEAGVQQLAESGAGNALSRVLLLSDGQANQGLQTLDEITPHCKRWHAQGVSTTTVGLGHGFNEDLMLGMARAGGGQGYYGQTAEDLHDSFDEELSLLQSLFLRMLRVKPAPADGIIVEPLGQLAPLEGGWAPVSDLPYAAESWLLVRLHVPPQAASGGALRPVLAGSFEAQRKDGAAVQLNLPMLSLPVVSAEAYAALPEDETVARRLKEVQFAEAALRAREMMVRGEIDGARAYLKHQQALVAGHPWLQEKLARLQDLAERDAAMSMKEMRYKSNRLMSRVAEAHESRYIGDETADAGKPAFLRRKSEEGRGRRKP